jgi:S-methylmethionine-dependent homocysteine/selenocysteine methylase
MARYRNALPQLDGSLFLTDGGIETTLIFHEGLDLPFFAAFDLLKNAEGEAALRKYFRTYAALARRTGAGIVLESATWRANPDWGSRLGYSREALAGANRQAIRLLEEIRAELGTGTRSVLSGCVGPRGDGYDPGKTMSEEAAESYHAEQIEVFRGTAADMVTAITMTSPEEAIGVARAARRVEMPVVISFTVETDGRLPTGQALRAAIEQVDARTGAYPAYYMINCAHPSHFEGMLGPEEPWTRRIRGLRANASVKSHAELNESSELDVGDPVALGGDHARLKAKLPWINVLGGCCGTDDRHVEQMVLACASPSA